VRPPSRAIPFRHRHLALVGYCSRQPEPAPSTYGVNSMRVVITNSQLYNGGDAAIVYGIITVLKENFGSSCEIIVFDPDADGARKYYPNLNVKQMVWPTFLRYPKSFRWTLTRLGFHGHRLRYRYFRSLLTPPEREAFSAFSSANLVISTGGTYLVENYDLRGRLFELYLAIFAGTPAILYTQSLGPFEQAKHKRAIRRVCRAAPLVLLRDAKSVRNLLDIGVARERLCIAADAAFGLADPVTLVAASNIPTTIRRVAISVRYWGYFKTKSNEDGMNTYLCAIGRAVDWLVTCLRAEVVFLSTCQGVKEYWAKDSNVAQEIVEMLPPRVRRSVEINDKFHSPDQLVRILKDFDLVIATRMHMAILALVSGVPVLPIAYEFKTEELFASELEMGDWVLSIESLTEASIVNVLPRYIDMLPHLRQRLFSAVGRLKENALNVGLVLRSISE
jgi:colanic acid/amylovoran biosynthesis protein